MSPFVRPLLPLGLILVAIMAFTAPGRSLGQTVAVTTPTWRGNGPYGGTVFALAIDPKNSARVYAGTEQGIFASTDGGATWRQTSVGLGSKDIHTLIVAPTNSSVLYAGTADSGIYMSKDGGATWWPGNYPLGREHVDAVAVAPDNSEHAYAGFGDGGVFHTWDGGHIWHRRLPDKVITSLVADSSRPDFAYAAGGAIFKTTDGGETWGWSSAGITGEARSLAIDPENSSVLYAGAWPQGVYRSADSGLHWTVARTGLPDGEIDVTALAISGGQPGVLYAALSDGRVFRSTDGATRWTETATIPHGDYEFTVSNTLAVDPNDPQVLYGTMNQLDGPYKSVDGGASWFLSNTGINNSAAEALAVDPIDGRVAYATTFDYIFRVWKTADAGGSWQNIAELDAEPLQYAIDPRDSSIIYARTGYPGEVIRSIDGGTRWESAGMKNPFANDIAFGGGSEILYAATNVGLYRTDARALAWTRVDSVAPNPCASIQRLAADPSNPDLLFAWCNQTDSSAVRGFYRTSDGGRTWRQLSDWWPESVTWWLLADASVIDFAHPGVVYEAQGWKVRRSADYGITWSAPVPVSYGNVTSLALDPHNPIIIYASTEGNGVARSLDSGATWTLINTGLTDKRVRQVAISPANPSALYARTFGRGIFTFVEGELVTSTPTASPTATATVTATATSTPTVTPTPGPKPKDVFLPMLLR